MQISKVIRKYGYTLEMVAKKIGLKSSGSLRCILSRKGDKDAAPSLTTLRKIADAVGCSVGEFFDDERNITREFDGVQPVLDIRSKMRAQKVKGKELAKRLGMTEQGVSAMLAKENVTLATLYKVADVLHVPITDLFRYEDKESRPE